MHIAWPNLVTLARLALVAPVAAGLFWYQQAPRTGLRWAVLALFAVTAGTDFLDGYLARRLKQYSAIGRFLDPLADKLLVLSTMTLLVFLGIADDRSGATQWLRLPGLMLAVSLAKDVIVTAGHVALRAGGWRGEVTPRLLGKLCTTAQLVAVGACLLWPELPAGLRNLPLWLAWAATGLAAAATLDYLAAGIRTYRMTAAAARRG